MTFETIYGVDFSGAKLAGRNTWVATLQRRRAGKARPRLALAELACVERLCGTAQRAASLAPLVAGACRTLRFPGKNKRKNWIGA